MAEDDRHGRGTELAELTFPGFLEEDGAGTGELVARLTQVHSTLEAERAAAPALAAELLAAGPERQRELAKGSPRFQTWGLCELLLVRGLAAAEHDPVESGHLASLALAASEHLDAERHAVPVVADLQARAWGCLVGARLSEGDLAGAEAALRSAASCLAHGTGDLLVEGNLLELEASVRQAQGRMGEAAALLKQAASRYREIGDTDLLARTQRTRELMLQASGLAGTARVSFRS